MSRFANLLNEPSKPTEVRETVPTSAQENRIGRKVISGYFSPAMSVAMRTTAMRRGITLQQAMGEAFDLWLRENGESPIGQ